MRPALSKPEFVALIGMLFATVAFSIDAMLPAMPEIAAELSPDAPNQAQLIITIENLEILGQPGFTPVRLQQTVCQPVKRTYPHSVSR